MGPSRTTEPSNRRHHRHSTPPSPSVTKARYDDQPATSSSLPSDHNPYSPSDDDDPLCSPAYASSNNSLYETVGYIPVVPLPVFEGEPDECPFAHLLHFDCVCRVNNAASPAFAAHIFPASLDSYASLWYLNAINHLFCFACKHLSHVHVNYFRFFF